MFDAIAGRYEQMNRLLTFGLDSHWRRACVDALALGPDTVVLDLACGTGDTLRILASSGHRPIGVDLSAGMLARARGDAPLLRGVGERLPLADHSVDGATSSFALRNFTDLAAVLAELARVVRPGGPVALLDVSTPEHPLLRLGHGLYFGHVVPAIGGLLSDRDAYRYLPRSLEYLPPTPELSAMIADAGFAVVHRSTLTGGAAQLFTALRQKAPAGAASSEPSGPAHAGQPPGAPGEPAAPRDAP